MNTNHNLSPRHLLTAAIVCGVLGLLCLYLVVAL